jgi:glycosyltransferase involved in cell wall biosynthesis
LLRLESFSNTVAEAWTMGKPLLVSDLDWAREACGDGAHYFRYDDATDAAAAIVRLREDAAWRTRFIDAGKKMMATYPSSEERFLQYLRVIESRCARESGGKKG